MILTSFIIIPLLAAFLIAVISGKKDIWAINISGIAVLAIFLLLFSDTPVSSFFWSSVAYTIQLLGIDFQLVIEGFNLFRFWI